MTELSSGSLIPLGAPAGTWLRSVVLNPRGTGDGAQEIRALVPSVRTCPSTSSGPTGPRRTARTDGLLKVAPTEAYRVRVIGGSERPGPERRHHVARLLRLHGGREGQGAGAGGAPAPRVPEGGRGHRVPGTDREAVPGEGEDQSREVGAIRRGGGELAVTP